MSTPGRKDGAFLVGYDRMVTRQDYLALTDALGYGDDVTEPAADPRELIDPLTDAMHAAHEHDECPVWCDDCDQWEKPSSCEPCHGSGCGPGTMTGAYEPCGDCGGDGTDHRPYTPTGTWRGRSLDGCDCTELCAMGPTCPGGSLAGLPGSGCWRTK